VKEEREKNTQLKNVYLLEEKERNDS